jgi:HD-like signal output (HDOD) protein/nitrogen-specific signal transduction histidine kinase
LNQIPGAVLEAIESIQLPSFPQVLHRFLSAVNDDQVTMAELATMAGQDPALSARILTVANSPAMRRVAEVKSLDKCLVVLGTRLMRTISACLAIQSVFARTTGDLGYNLTGFWAHSLRTAELAYAIASHVDYPDADEAYLAGLMHDIGQLLLLGGMSDRYGVLLDRSADEAALLNNEDSLLGTDHAAVGAWLIDQWQLSSFMADAVLFHHMPANEIVHADFLSQIVWSADIIGNNKKTDLLQNESNTNIAAITSILGIKLTDAVAIQQLCFERVDKLATALDIQESSQTKTIPYLSTPFEYFRTKLNDSDVAYSRIEALVRDMATMHSLQLSLAELCRENEIVTAVRESARILFGLGKIAFLFVQHDKKSLSGANIGGQSDLFQHIEISLDRVQSLAAAVVLGKQPSSTFDDECSATVSLVDVRIARALKCEGLLYVPMSVRGNNIGIMAYGVSAAQYARILPRLGWMAGFANLAADSIETWRELRRREQELETTLTSRFEQQARKVVHETGNPLGIIKNYLKIVSRKLPDEHDVQQELTILGEEIDRVTQIVRSLGELVETPPATGAFDVNAVIGEMLALYGESLFSSCGIALIKSLEANLSPVGGDRDSFKQILFNIWKNGSEAMPEGGHFIISTRGNIIHDEQHYIEIHLSDSGPGIPQEVMERLFQPLPTNRRPGHFGVGLSIVASMVERLGGQISCQSQAGKGTSFIILLPQPKGCLKE